MPVLKVEDVELLVLKGKVSSGYSIDDFLIDLLSRIYKSKASEVRKDYSTMLRRFIRNKCWPIDVDLGDDVDIRTPFRKQPIQTQVKILHSLCYFQFHPEMGNYTHFFDNADEGLLRTEAVGVDSKNFSYWYFSGNRLYRSKGEKWEIVCYNAKDWVKLMLSLFASKNEQEKLLFNQLKELRKAEDSRAYKIKR